MITSKDRILTTTVGSMPRPQHVVDMLFEKDRGDLTDVAAFDKCMHQAVIDVVARQMKVDPDICFAKLESLARGAELATERLWRPQ